MTECREGRWLLLIHQLPPRPAYLRVKVWRRLQGLGAVALKNTVYVLPKADDTIEDFQWVAREIEKDGGEATIRQPDRRDVLVLRVPVDVVVEQTE